MKSRQFLAYLELYAASVNSRQFLRALINIAVAHPKTGNKLDMKNYEGPLFDWSAKLGSERHENNTALHQTNTTNYWLHRFPFKLIAVVPDANCDAAPCEYIQRPIGQSCYTR